MINYYEYETSPRKIEPEYKSPKSKKKTVTKKKVNTKTDGEARKTAKYMIEIGLVFAVLLVISYRYALIDIAFNEKEELKATLAGIQKENAQLELNIEKATNINTIEQQAKEKLGMKKLDNNQKVYVSLPKEDYVEPSTEKVNKEEETWWEALINDLFHK